VKRIPATSPAGCRFRKGRSLGALIARPVGTFFLDVRLIALAASSTIATIPQR
jgi:hypothetical protein